MLERLSSPDRRLIFVLVALAVIIPTLARVSLPIHVAGPTRNVYDSVEALPEGSVVIVSFDYGPASMAELQPMGLAVLRHLFSKRIKVIGMALWPTGVPLGDEALTTIADEFGAQEGEDYVYLGYRAGTVNVILRMGEDIHAVFDTDTRGVPLSERPMMQSIHTYNDIDLLIDLGAGDSPEWWVTYGYTRYHQKVAAGVTGVIVSQLYPYIQTGQLVGLMPGLLGAAEYETLVEHPAKATLGMSVQSMVHLLLIALIIVGNVTYFLIRRREGMER